MSVSLLPDSLWNLIQPHLPAEPPRPKRGRLRIPDRAALTGILFVLTTGWPGQTLPRELGCGSGSTCWRRLRDWQRTGVWERLHRLLLDRLGSRGRIDWSRASLDSASIPAKGGEATGPNPTDRGRPGTKRHLLMDRNGIPLAALISPANWHDSRLLEPLLDAIQPIKGPWGRPRKRPDKLHGDKGYDVDRCRDACRKRGIDPRIARRGVESSEQLGRRDGWWWKRPTLGLGNTDG